MAKRGTADVVYALKRRWYRGTMNTPYLSGDFFRSCSDAVLDDGPGSKAHFESLVAEARVIFVKSDLLPEFFAVYSPRAVACRVLISGNSDVEIHDMPGPLPPQLRVWFAQNVCLRHPVIAPLPIGLENQALAVNGERRLFRPCTAAEVAAKRLSIWVAFDSARSDRAALLDSALTAGTMTVEPSRLPPREFQQRLRRHRFVLAPRGNGIDTHRFWEALYADAIPVTLRSPWSVAMREHGVPCVDVEDWRDVFTWSVDDLVRLSASLPERPSRTPWLWAPYWRERLAVACAEAQTTAPA